MNSVPVILQNKLLEFRDDRNAIVSVKARKPEDLVTMKTLLEEQRVLQVRRDQHQRTARPETISFTAYGKSTFGLKCSELTDFCGLLTYDTEQSSTLVWRNISAIIYSSVMKDNNTRRHNMTLSYSIMYSSVLKDYQQSYTSVWWKISALDVWHWMIIYSKVWWKISTLGDNDDIEQSSTPECDARYQH